VTGPGFDVDPAQVGAVGARMTGSTEALGAAAGGGAGVPVAGTATAPVMDFLQAVTEATARFTEAVQRSGETVGRAAAGYVAGDGSAASRIGAVPVPGAGGPGAGG
jgi:hypothetical protein